MDIATRKAVEAASLRCLIDNNIFELPVSLTTIARNSSVKIIKNTDANELQSNESGISLLIGTEYFIVYDDTQSRGRCRFTIAHELGHIFLGHLLINSEGARTFDTSRPQIEQEADLFASRLLAPSCVLFGLGVKTPAQIAKYCDLSYNAARIRNFQMQRCKQSDFLSSNLEQMAYNNFKEFIEKNNVRWNK